MEKPWFQNRKCLDIGCNEGMITLALASHFGSNSMIGVDIDRSLIGKASRCMLAKPCALSCMDSTTCCAMRAVLVVFALCTSLWHLESA